MNWFKRTFQSKKQEVRGKKMEAPAFSSYFLLLTSYFLLLTSYSKFRLFTPVLLALFTGFLMIHTAAVISAPVSFSSGGGQTGGLEVFYEG
jgi:hypothetical protein